VGAGKATKAASIHHRGECNGRVGNQKGRGLASVGPTTSHSSLSEPLRVTELQLAMYIKYVKDERNNRTES
jgi:hypothetical protein